MRVESRVKYLMMTNYFTQANYCIYSHRLYSLFHAKLRPTWDVKGNVLFHVWVSSKSRIHIILLVRRVGCEKCWIEKPRISRLFFFLFSKAILRLCYIIWRTCLLINHLSNSCWSARIFQIWSLPTGQQSYCRIVWNLKHCCFCFFFVGFFFVVFFFWSS